MFGVEILGGLGNMLFCVTMGEWLEHKYKMKVVYPNAHRWFNALPTASTWTTHAEEYKTIFRHFDWFKNEELGSKIIKVKQMPFRHNPFIPQNRVCYAGYFQSYRNFDADFVRERFKPSDSVKQRLDAYNYLFGVKTCSIHVRRGNYVGHDSHVTQTMDYYNKAMKIINADRYLVFSNDVLWCKENFIGEKFIFVEDTDYIEMFLMSRCTHNIIGNSSFSYWGAMFGNPEGRKVTYPSNWFPNNNPDAHDICPPKWIKL